MEQDNLLPEPDRDYLAEKGYVFEIIPQNGVVHLILKEIGFSEAYNPKTADILIMVPTGYPNVPLDMFWTFPEIKYANGNVPVATEVRQQLHGKNWQRWSRHHPGWRPGLDNLRTFLTVILKEVQ